MRLTLLGLSTLLLAHVASSQEPMAPARHDQAAPRLSARFTHTEAIESQNQVRLSFRQSTGGGLLGFSAVPAETQTPDELLAAVGLHNLSIRVSSWRAVGRGPVRGHTVEGSWKLTAESLLFARFDCVARDDAELVQKRQQAGITQERTSVDVGTLGFVRNVRLFHEAQIGVGSEVTLYQFGSNIDPMHGRHPVSIHGFFRIRFGSHVDTSQTSSPIGHSMSM